MIARLCALMLLSGSVAAHDFWIQPETYRAEPGAIVPVTLQVGHGPDRQRSMLPGRRITRFAAIAPDATSVDLRDSLDLGGSTEDGQVEFSTPGTHWLVLETDNRARSLQPAARFNNYVRDEGLAAVLEQRAMGNRMDADGAESYSRHSKALVQVGTSAGASGSVTQPVGMPLEIVPEINPYAVPMVANLPIRVLFADQPLAGARVKLTNLGHDAEPVETHLTDADGRASFAIPGRGKWLLNVIWSRPWPVAGDTDFETYFSSLSFGR